MKITKFGHACLLVEDESTRILIDPGVYSDGFQELTNLDAILVTHKHGDHCDVKGIKKLMEANPNVTIYSNSDVKQVLAADGIVCTEVSVDADEITGYVYDSFEVEGISIEAHEASHEEIYPEHVSLPENTAFIIGGRVLVTGDSLSFVPIVPVDILALPVVAPWGKTSEFIDFARAVKPNTVIPVHDGIAADNLFSKFPNMVLPPLGIEVVVLENGVENTF